jgi:hypothetical protein
LISGIANPAFPLSISFISISASKRQCAYGTKNLRIRMKNHLFSSKAMADALTSAGAELTPIIADAIYPLEDFKRRTGLESASVRKMRQQGFVVRRIGRRSYVRGSDFLSWFENAPQVGA